MLGVIAILCGICFAVHCGNHTQGKKNNMLSDVHAIHVTSRPKLEAFAAKTARVPVLGLFSSFIQDWIPLIEDYYYCEFPTF